MGDLLNLFWILLLIQLFLPIIRRRMVEYQRQATLRKLERERGSRVITLIHRQETMSFLGIPIARYISIEDSEQVLRAIRLTAPGVPIDIVLHTPGGLVLASEQIAYALKHHAARVTVFVPHYAMSGGTLIALAAGEIVMDPNAVLGPLDPQLGDPQRGTYPANSILAALQQPNPNRDDATLILGDVATKAIHQVDQAVYDLVRDRMSDEQARAFSRVMSSGCWTHDYPIFPDEARRLGLHIDENMPRLVYDLMQLYPQPGQNRPSVEYIPIPYRPAVPPARGKER